MLTIHISIDFSLIYFDFCNFIKIFVLHKNLFIKCFIKLNLLKQFSFVNNIKKIYLFIIENKFLKQI